VEWIPLELGRRLAPELGNEKKEGAERTRKGRLNKQIDHTHLYIHWKEREEEGAASLSFLEDFNTGFMASDLVLLWWVPSFSSP
jgi:hypothetical protein